MIVVVVIFMVVMANVVAMVVSIVEDADAVGSAFLVAGPASSPSVGHVFLGKVCHFDVR